MKILKIILVTLVALAALIAVTGFLILPAVLKSVLPDKISAALHRQATVEQIQINPFALSATLRGFKLADTDGKTPFVSLGELTVNVDVLTSIARRALILEEVRLDSPYVGLTRNADGSYNFSDLIPAKKEQPEEPSEPFLFSVNNIQIAKGAIDFRDRPNRTDHTVRDLTLSVPFVSNIDYYMKHYVEPKFSAVVNGHAVAVSGKTQPFLTSRESLLEIDIRDIDVPFYLQYVPVRMNFTIREARLDAMLQLHFLMPEGKSPQLKLTGRTVLKNLALDDLQKNKLLRLPSLSVELASVEPFAPAVHLQQITLSTPQLVVRRDKQGKINLLNLVQTDKKSARAAAEDKPAGGAEKKKPLVFSIDRLLVDKADITFIDEQPAQPVRLSLSPLTLGVSGFSLQKGDSADLDLALVLDKKTNLSAKGPFGIDPLAADLALDVKNLTIRSFQSYFPETLQMDVTRGAIFTAGRCSLAMDEQNKPRVKYTGNLSIRDLATLDKAQAHDFLKWKQLNFQSLAAGYNPLFVTIREISLVDFFAKIVINPGGGTNLQDIFGASKKEAAPADKSEPAPPPAAETAKPQQAPPDIKIGQVRFAGGTVDFADRNIKPNYAVTMLNLTGSVTGLSSQEISRAKVALKGNLGYGSPIDISGTVNPLKKDLFADIKISFKDIEMSPVTPYTNRYLGYPITKGKLNFDVAYLIDQRKLRAENKIFFDQLTFGDRVESPEAIKAPVPLAVSLLTDRNGQINLDVPLSGSLDDPKFRIWPLVWQVLVNLITKAVTSPFSLLSSLTGGGEEMSFVEFDYGSAVLPEADGKKITALAKALYDRPQLKLEISGFADTDRDKEALAKAEFDRRLKAQKLKELLAAGASAVPLAEITIAPAEYEKYLTLAYKAGDFPKPRTALGVLKTLPPPEMEKRLRDAIAITDGDLGQLAANRAQAVRELLLKDGKIEPARLFLVKAPSLAPEKKDKVRNSRVDFKIK